MNETLKNSLYAKINSKIALNKVHSITRFIICWYVSKFNKQDIINVDKITFEDTGYDIAC